MEQEKTLKYPNLIFILIGAMCVCLMCYSLQEEMFTLQLEFDMGMSRKEVLSLIDTLRIYSSIIIIGPVVHALFGKSRAIVIMTVANIVGLLICHIPLFFSFPFQRSVTILACGLVKISYVNCIFLFVLYSSEEFILPEQKYELRRFSSMVMGLFMILFILRTTTNTNFNQIERPSVWNKWKFWLFGLNLLVTVGLCVVLVISRKRIKIFKNQQRIFQLPKCYYHALKARFKGKDSSKKKLLDYAYERCDTGTVNDMKQMVAVMRLLFIIMPIFWAVHHCMMYLAKWEITHVNRSLGGIELGRNDVLIFKHVLVIIFLVISECALHPLLRKRKIATTMLQRMCVGGLIGVITTFSFSVLEYYIQKTYVVVPSEGGSNLNIYNGIACDIHISLPEIFDKDIIVRPYSLEHLKDIPSTGTIHTDVKIESYCKQKVSVTTEITIEEKKSSTFFVTLTGQPLNRSIEARQIKRDSIPYRSSKVILRVIYDLQENKTVIMVLKREYREKKILLHTNTFYTNFIDLETCKNCHLYIDNNDYGKLALEAGEIYSLLIVQKSNGYDFNLISVTPTQLVHMAWMIPLFILITIYEILVIIGSAEFVFTQSPLSMRYFILTVWYGYNFFGRGLFHLFTVDFILYKDYKTQFIVYGAIYLFFVDTFIILCYCYKYVELNSEEELVERPVSSRGSYSKRSGDP